MSRAIVGRIFWKELRTLRSLWLTLAAVACVLEVLVALWLTHSRPWWAPEKMLTAATGALLVGYAVAVLYAIATASAAFTAEWEGTTGTLLRAVPVTRGQAFAGKWTYGIISTAALLLGVVLIALIVNTVVGPGLSAASPWSLAPRGAFATDEAPLLAVNVWMCLLLPIEFFALCALFSLVFSNVLAAAALGTFVSILASCGWWIGPAWINALFIVGVISADFWLTGIWLERGPLATWETSEAEGSWRGLSRLFHAWAPTAPWQRAAQCLCWKEVRQAAPFAGIALLAAVATCLNIAFNPDVNSPPASSMFFRWMAHWIAFLSIPLLMGIAAYNVEQRGHLFRVLGERGAAVAGSWMVKHLVWLGLASSVCLFLIVLDRVAAGWSFNRFGRLLPHRDAPDSIWEALAQAMVLPTMVGTRLPNPSVSASTIFGTLSLYVLVAYSVGQCFSLLVRKSMVAFGLAAGATVLACATWGMLYDFGVPIAWTVGFLPVVLLALTFSLTGRWQIGRSPWESKTRIVAWLVVPTMAVTAGVLLYRIYEIPWMPNAVDQARLMSNFPRERAEQGDGSLWASAAVAIATKPESNRGVAGAPRSGPEANRNDWSNVGPAAQKKLVAQFSQSIELAMEAAKHSPTAINTTTAMDLDRKSDQWSRLAQLLAFSAGECESEGRLDDAWQRYQAALHLAVCLSYRYETWFEGRRLAIDTLHRMRGWAGNSKQTAARFKQALFHIQILNQQTQPLTFAVEAEWKKWLRSPDKFENPTSVDPLFVSSRSAWPGSTRLAHPLFPWEAARDRRIVNALFQTTLAGAANAEKWLYSVGGWFSPSGQATGQFDADCVDVLSWLSTTPSMNRGQCAFAQDVLLAVVNFEAKRRMEVLALCLESFHGINGRYPARLEEVELTAWLRLSDPWTGRDFFYSDGKNKSVYFGRNGVVAINADSTAFVAPRSARERRFPIPSKTPFLISEGFGHYAPPLFQQVENRPLMIAGTESSSILILELK